MHGSYCRSMSEFDREAVAGLGAASRRAARQDTHGGRGGGAGGGGGRLASTARRSAHGVPVLIPVEGFALRSMCCLLGWWPWACG